LISMITGSTTRHVNPDPRDRKSEDGRITYDVFFQVSDDYRTGTASAAQSRISGRRQNPWLSPIGGGYQDGVLYDDLALASPFAKKRGCGPRPSTTVQEAQE
jgi:hypothetical protein